MNGDQIKRAVLAAWAKVEDEANGQNEKLTERDMRVWLAGFMAGGAALSEHLAEKFGMKGMR